MDRNFLHEDIELCIPVDNGRVALHQKILDIVNSVVILLSILCLLENLKTTISFQQIAVVFFGNQKMK